MHLITGGSGFVGSNIASLLIKRGERVRVVDIWRSGELPKEVEYLECDVTDREAIFAAMEGVDYVHHTAALVPLAKAGDQFRNVNVEGTRNVLDAAEAHGVRFLAHLSSSAVFGSPDDMPISNDTPRIPVEIYGHSKKIAEDLVISAMERGMAVSIIRPRTIIGTARLGIFQILFDWIRDGANIFIIGSGDQLFQFVHVDDLCMASIQSCLLEKPGIYNIGTTNFRTLREDVSALCNHAGTGSRVRSLPVKLSIWSLTILDKLGLSPLSPWHYKTYHKAFYFNSEADFERLEYLPQYGNVETMVLAYDWFVENYDNQVFDKNASSHKSPVRQGVLSILKRLSKYF